MKDADEKEPILIERSIIRKTNRYYYDVDSADGRIRKRINDSTTISDLKWIRFMRKSFQDVFLPQGFPFTVSSDYINYQIWDTIQAFCSTINGTLTTHAVFKGVGVGDSTATALSATITWILKDGTGMVGRIGFAWWKGYSLDTDCKKWRLAADIVNDVAMCIELLLGVAFLKGYSPFVLCCSTGMKSIVGVAGGATRASITQHQAIHNNMGDVSAKDGSQETCVNLIASFLGVFLLTLIENSATCTWILFLTMTSFHIFANYKAVKSLQLKTLNTSRLNLLVRSYMQCNQILDIPTINREEDVFIGFGLTDFDLCGRKIYLGSSLDEKKTLESNNLKYLGKLYVSKRYFIHYDDKEIHVMLQTNALDEDIIMAYFHALILGIVLSYDESKNRGRYLRFSNYFRDILMNHGNSEVSVNDFIDDKWDHFKNSLKATGWIVNQHQLIVNDWRIDWNH